MSNLFLSFTLALTMLSGPSFASEASDRIAKAVKAISPLAQSGVQSHKVKPASSVKAMLLALALKTGYSESESDFSWVGKSGEAWAPDSMNWGEETMKGAYNYVMTVDKDYLESLNEEGNEKEKAKLEKNLKSAKAAWKLLLNSGVQFGVAPLGAVQCGVTFAALAIIDPATGKIYVFAKEGSGC